MEEEIEKINFFKRIKISIFNLEKYKIFTKEKFSTAFKYILLLILIITIVLSITSTIQVSGEVSKLVSYIKNDFPEFTYKDGNLQVDGFVNAFDEEYQAKLIVDTSDKVSDEKIKEYKKDREDSIYSVILLKDKLIFKLSGDYEYEYHYSDIASSLGIGDITKQELVDNYLNSNGMTKINAVIWIYAFLSLFIMNFLTVLEDVIIVAVFGWLAAKISKVALTFSKSASLAVYSLTLSIILSTIYSVVHTFVDFEIKYFTLLYMLIAYIYMVASVMMMKENSNREAGEAVTVDGQVIKESSEENKDEKEEDKKEDKDKKPDDNDKEDNSKEELPTDEPKKDNTNNEEKKDK